MIRPMNAQEDSTTQSSPSKREVKRLRSSDKNDSKSLPAVVWVKVMQCKIRYPLFYIVHCYSLYYPLLLYH